ncbi:response regulator [Nostoc sp. MS1]|uniref:response regulator n=1 Tax=Nostoc sp. MS1 TaxID=2764711 RepID=UPI001CC639F0|nr:response regulator [Nostoc sp. MS1]BCL34071.1 hypothetical protein NSMS1_05180 [Nostoc sp. MS1]
MDLDNPQINCLDLTNKIRAIPKYQDLPLVMLSAKSKQSVEVKQIASEFTAFLHKPLRHYQLHKTLLQIVRGQWLIDAPQAIIPSYSRLSKSHLPAIDDQLSENLPLKILLAEDVLVNQKIALKMLQKLGYRADVANDGLEALEAVQRQTYDVVFMDVQMPEMDGWETTRRIRQEVAASSQPWIIAMTAHARPEDRQQCLAAGMDDYITKPINLEEITAVLKKLGAQAASQPQPLASVPQTASAIDESILQQLRDMMGDDGDRMIAELIELYLEDTPKMIETMQDAIAKADITQLKKTAHALRSPTVSIGAVNLGKLCETLEDIAATQSIDEVSTVVNELNNEYHNVVITLQHLYPRKMAN